MYIHLVWEGEMLMLWDLVGIYTDEVLVSYKGKNRLEVSYSWALEYTVAEMLTGDGYRCPHMSMP